MREVYKNPLLGRIPKDWEVMKFGDTLSESPEYGANASAKPYTEGTYRYIRITDILFNGRLTNENIVGISKEEGIQYELEQDDILIARTGNTVGKSFLYNRSYGLCSYAGYLIRFKPNKTILNPHYISQYLHSAMFWRWISTTVRTGAQPNVNSKEYQSMRIPLPPLQEQQKIASILSTVDEKIENIDQQIKETQELKKGMMQRLLIKGIGHTKFKDSPLGEIPESWEVKSLKEIARCSVGIASSATHAYSDSGILLIRNQNIKEGRLDLSDVLHVTEEYEEQHRSKRLKGGDILTVRTGYPGISAVVPSHLEGAQSFTTLIIRRESEVLSSEFLCYYINSDKGKSFFNSSKAGGGQKNVGSKTLESMKVPIPKSEEQTIIVNVLSVIDEKLSHQKRKRLEYLDLKRGLMQQLLTGKTRVQTEELG